jgi:putative hemolysin
MENIPQSGGVVFASNHPLGGFDAMVILDSISRVRTDVKFIVNDILLNLKNLKPLFVGVNKHGKNSVKMLEDIDTAYGSDQAIFIYPAGLVSRKQDSGKIEDLEWKKSFITKAKKHQRMVVPLFVDGRNSNRFYNLARWRSKLGIKVNVEMFFLVDEMFRQRNKTITVIFGKPIPYTAFDNSKSDVQWALAVKKIVYDLAETKI